MNKYKIIYTNGQESPEKELLELIDKWSCTDGLGGCKYLRNGAEITLKEFSEDFNKSIEVEAGTKSDKEEDVIASSGIYAKVASSGDGANNNITGKNSVCFDCGTGGIIKGVKGTYIALCEWYYDGNEWKIRGTATVQIDGKVLKENTYYGLYNGKITEIDLTDNIKSAVIETKSKVKKVKLIDSDNNIITDKVSYVVANGNGNFAHGRTIKEAKKSLLYKISNRDVSKYTNLTLESEITFEEAIKMYRVITGACEFGVKNFVEQYKIDEKKKYTIKEIIELTEGQYGNQLLREFFKNKDTKFK